MNDTTDSSEFPPLCNPPSLEENTGNRFSAKAVEEFLNNEEQFSEEFDYPTHHYNQARYEWGGTEAVGTLFDRFELQPAELTVTVFGGFTGEFARSLRDLGCEVIFTEPIAEWAKRAESAGFETYNCSAEMIPGEVVDRTDVFATFECYYPFKGSISYIFYNMLRFLTAPHGILVAETTSTRDVRRENGANTASIASLNLLLEHVDAKRQYRETGDFRIYQYYHPESTWYNSWLFASLIRNLYTHRGEGSKTEIDEEMLDKVSIDSMEPFVVSDHISNIIHIYRQFLGEMAMYVPSNEMQICDHTFVLVD